MKVFSKLALSSSVGNSGLGFGCMGITAFYGQSMSNENAMELLQVVYDAKCRHFDTAELYATEDKHNESVLGAFFQTVPRDSFTVATKFWPATGQFDYDTVKASLTKSLERLQLEYVDLYYAHRVTDLNGAMEFGRTARRLVDEGLIKEVGISEISAKWLKQVHTEVCPIAAVQQEWSLLTRNLEEKLVPMCKELDIDIVAYSPLARNLLAKKMETAPTDWRKSLPRYSEENLAKNQNIANQVQELATKYKCTPAQLSLAWLFYKAKEMGVTVIPIPGSTKQVNALSNLESTKVVLDDPKDIELLESLADQVAGLRATEDYIEQGIESQKS
jgi:aryl-alcohol dehydrogenase-like predicted oxidoreductase